MNIKKRFSNINKNSGMTYIEIIVVLSIFAVLTSVVMFNYGKFQGKVDIKNLGSDIALKIVEAQKASFSGKLPPPVQYNLLDAAQQYAWKPSYGVYFNSSSSPDASDGNIPFNRKFLYFTDVISPDFTGGVPYTGIYTGATNCTQECLERIQITKGNYISHIGRVYGPSNNIMADLTNLTATFSRTNFGVVLSSNGVPLASDTGYARITISSPRGATSYIRLYPSGRVDTTNNSF